MQEFDTLQYKNKVLFTCREHSDMVSAFYSRGFESLSTVG